MGLTTEALIFAIAAFEPVDEGYDWSLVYQELAGGDAGAGIEVAQANEAEGVLSKKLDNLLEEANIDVKLFENLGASIKSFEGAAKKHFTYDRRYLQY